MKRYPLSIWIIEGLLAALLIFCISQFAIKILRCSSIRQVKYQEDAPKEIMSQFPDTPKEIVFDGKTYEIAKVNFNTGKEPEIMKKPVDCFISGAGLVNYAVNIDIYKIRDVSPDIAVAINNDTGKSYTAYINREYLWECQWVNLGALSLFSIILSAVAILIFKKREILVRLINRISHKFTYILKRMYTAAKKHLSPICIIEVILITVLFLGFIRPIITKLTTHNSVLVGVYKIPGYSPDAKPHTSVQTPGEIKFKGETYEQVSSVMVRPGIAAGSRICLRHMGKLISSPWLDNGWSDINIYKINGINPDIAVAVMGGQYYLNKNYSWNEERKEIFILLLPSIVLITAIVLIYRRFIKPKGIKQKAIENRGRL